MEEKYGKVQNKAANQNQVRASESHNVRRREVAHSGRDRDTTLKETAEEAVREADK